MSDVAEMTQLRALVLAQQSKLAALQKYAPLVDLYKACEIEVKFDKKRDRLAFYDEEWKLFAFTSTGIWYDWGEPLLTYDRLSLSIFKDDSIMITFVQREIEIASNISIIKQTYGVFELDWALVAPKEANHHDRPLLACEVERIRDGLLEAAARWGWDVQRE